jgi:predicted TIM-barrel fold metal-dependent hydrolase
MDHFGIERSMIGIEGEPGVRAMQQFPERFIASCSADANNGVDEVRKIRRLYEEFGLKAVGTFPAGCTPQVPIDHARWYPIYSVCAELGIPIFICAGIPGPRVPSMCQHVELLDIVCYDFPELKIVTRHGCQPWTELAVKLMLKWPNLYYSTSAFAPQHYDPRIIDYANSRGSDRVIYAGYWPMGLTYERIMGDMPKVPFKKDVWPKFLRQNALNVLGLSDLPG